MAVTGPAVSESGVLYGHHGRVVDEVVGTRSGDAAIGSAYASKQNCLIRVFAQNDVAGNVYLKETDADGETTRDIVLGAVPINELREFLCPISSGKSYAVHFTPATTSAGRVWADVVNA